MSKLESIELISKSGFSAHILPLGGIITKIMAKDKHGRRENVVLNYENFDDYFSNPLFLGCFVGPIAGRTKDGKLFIDDDLLQLDVSKHPNALHSGKDGLHNVIWDIKSRTTNQVILTHEAHPLNASHDVINYQLTYTVSDETLAIDFLATCSTKTYLSLTNHSYFNLSGNPDQSILMHNLNLNCSHIARLDQESLPIDCLPLGDLGEAFNTERLIGSIIESTPHVFASTSGIDHPFKCEDSDYVVTLIDPESGRTMHVATTQPYVIIYSGNFLHTAISDSGKQFNQYSGICFETQDLPNVTNNKLGRIRFVTPEAPYSHRTSFSFSAK